MAEAPSNLVCPRCKFVGKSVQSLKVHIGRVHGAASTAKTAKRGPGRRRRGRRCKICGKIIKTAAALKAHMTRKHAGAPVGSAAGGTRALTALDKDLMTLSLPALADLYEAARRELHRRLPPMAE